MILFVNPPSSRVLYPQIGLAVMSSVLKEQGYTVTIADLIRQKDYRTSFARIVQDTTPDIIGFYSVTRSFHVVEKLIKTARALAPESCIIFGGPHATFSTDVLVTHKEVDFIVRGEGELPMLEIARHYHELDTYIQKIPSLVYRQNGHIMHNTLAPPVNLDLLPLPDWDAFPLKRYWRIHQQVGRDPCISYESSRGCPYRCIFCLCYKLQQYRAKSPDTIVRELNMLSKMYTPNIGIIDPCFTANKYIKETLKKMITECDINWWDCQTHAACVDEEMLSLMKESGCIAVLYGIESGSQKILNVLRKGCTVTQNEKAIIKTKKAGLQVDATIIFGVPGETEDDLKKTVHLLKETEPDFIYINFMTPFPGCHADKHKEEYNLHVQGSFSDFGLDSFVIDLPKERIQLIQDTVDQLLDIFGEERVNIG